MDDKTLEFFCSEKAATCNCHYKQANRGFLEALQIIEKELGKNQSGINNGKGVVGDDSVKRYVLIDSPVLGILASVGTYQKGESTSSEAWLTSPQDGSEIEGRCKVHFKRIFCQRQ